MAFKNKHCFTRLSLCLLFMLAVAVGLSAEDKPYSPIPFKIIKGKIQKSADANDSSWDNYLEITGLAGKVTLCPTSKDSDNDPRSYCGFDPSQLKVKYLDEAKKLILICTDTYSQGSGGWNVYGRIVLQLNEKRDGFTEIYRNFFMGWVRAGWPGGGYSFEEIVYDEGSGFITISHSNLSVFRSKDKIPMSNYDSKFFEGVYQQRITKTTTFTCQIKDGKLIPLSRVSFVNCDAEKYSAAEFTEFCRENKINPLDKGSTAFPVVTEFAQPKSIPVETYEQASRVE